MGLAASQARLLSITSRLADNELRAQITNNAKMRLATESSRASTDYVNALNDATMMITNYDEAGNEQYGKLNFNRLTEYSPYNTQYGLANSYGQLLVNENEAAIFESVSSEKEFLKAHGLEFTTSYFDELKETTEDPLLIKDENGNVLTSVEHEELKAMYFGLDGHLGYEANSAEYDALFDKLNSIKEVVTSLKDNKAIMTLLEKKVNNYQLSNKTFIEYLKDVAIRVFTTDTSNFADENYTRTEFINLLNQIQKVEYGMTGSTSYYDSIKPKYYNNSVLKSTDEFAEYLKLTKNTTSQGDYYYYKYSDPYDYIEESKFQEDGYDKYNVKYINGGEEKTLTLMKSSKDGNYFYSENSYYFYDIFLEEDTANNTYTLKRKQTSTVKPAELETLGTLVIPQHDYRYVYSQLFNELFSYDNTNYCTNDTVIREIKNRVDLSEFMNKNFNSDDHNLENKLSAEYTVAGQNGEDALNKLKESITSGQKLLDKYFKLIGELQSSFGFDNASMSNLSFTNMTTFVQSITQNLNNSEFAKNIQSIYDAFVLNTVFDVYGEPLETWYDHNNPTGDAETKAQWYMNLYQRMLQGYTVLEDGLAASNEWIEFALESGLVSVEQVDKFNKWNGTLYSNVATITEVTDDVAVARAEAEYKRAMNEIESKDKRLDIELKNIDTEHNALQTEYESIKNVIGKNIERSFKMYNA